MVSDLSEWRNGIIDSVLTLHLPVGCDSGYHYIRPHLSGKKSGIKIDATAKGAQGVCQMPGFALFSAYMMRKFGAVIQRGTQEHEQLFDSYTVA